MKRILEGFIRFCSGRSAFAFNESAPGSRPDGRPTFYASEAIASVGLFVTLSAGKLVKATENGIAIGQNMSAVETADINVIPIAADLLSSGGEKSVTADGDITALARLVVGDSAGAKVLPTAAGTYYVVGVALTAAANGGTCRFMPCVPYPAVVTD